MLVDERLDWMMQRKRETPLTTLLGVRPAYRVLLPDTPLGDSTFMEHIITLTESHEAITKSGTGTGSAGQSTEPLLMQPANEGLLTKTRKHLNKLPVTGSEHH